MGQIDRLLVETRRALQDAAWPVPWRVSNDEVKAAYRTFSAGQTVAYAGDVLLWDQGEVRRLSYSHDLWRGWFVAGNARVSRELPKNFRGSSLP